MPTVKACPNLHFVVAQPLVAGGWAAELLLNGSAKEHPRLPAPCPERTNRNGQVWSLPGLNQGRWPRALLRRLIAVARSLAGRSRLIVDLQLPQSLKL